MNRRLNRELFLGFKSTPILTMLVFILGLCLLLDHIVEPNEDIKLICDTSSYDVEKPSAEVGKIRFEIERVANSIALEMTFVKANHPLVSVSAVGSLLEVSGPVLTYEIQLQNGKVHRDILNTTFSEEIRDQVEFVKESLILDSFEQEKSFYIKVLEMDKTLGFVSLQFSARNGLWACKIQ